MGYHRGPIACGIDANPLLNYESGIIKTEGEGVDHVISVVGWGKDDKDGQYWIVRNSWGEYWGEMGYVRVAFGALLVEEQCAWAVPSDFTAAERHNQVHGHEGGDNCAAKPSSDVFSSCTGSADPAGPACYQGKGGALGLTETVKVDVKSFASGKGAMTLSGSGIQNFNCASHSFSKSGQDVSVDLSDCLPSGVTVPDVKY